MNNPLQLFSIYLAIGFLVVAFKHKQLVRIQTKTIKEQYPKTYENHSPDDLMVSLIVILFVIIWPLMIGDLSQFEDK